MFRTPCILILPVQFSMWYKEKELKERRAERAEHAERAEVEVNQVLKMSG